MAFDFAADQPIYSQLLQELQLQIAAGHWKPGDKLPSVRELARDYRVNPNTVQRALLELDRTELCKPERTNGRFVTRDSRRIAAVREELAARELRRCREALERLGFDAAEQEALRQKERKDGQA